MTLDHTKANGPSIMMCTRSFEPLAAGSTVCWNTRRAPESNVVSVYSRPGVQALMTNLALGAPFGFSTPRVPTSAGPYRRTHSVSGDHSRHVSYEIHRAKYALGGAVEVACPWPSSIMQFSMRAY